MKKYFTKDLLKRHKFKHKEKKLSILKFLAFSNLINENLKKKIFSKIFLLKSHSITLLRKRCIITGRTRGLQSNFKISRIVLKDIVNRGEISLFKKTNN